MRLAGQPGRDARLLPAPTLADGVEDLRVTLGRSGLAELVRRVGEFSPRPLGTPGDEANARAVPRELVEHAL